MQYYSIIDAYLTPADFREKEGSINLEAALYCNNNKHIKSA
jgi:hypothetical protein